MNVVRTLVFCLFFLTLFQCAKNPVSVEHVTGPEEAAIASPEAPHGIDVAIPKAPDEMVALQPREFEEIVITSSGIELETPEAEEVVEPTAPLVEAAITLTETDQGTIIPRDNSKIRVTTECLWGEAAFILQNVGEGADGHMKSPSIACVYAGGDCVRQIEFQLNSGEGQFVTIPFEGNAFVRMETSKCTANPGEVTCVRTVRNCDWEGDTSIAGDNTNDEELNEGDNNNAETDGKDGHEDDSYDEEDDKDYSWEYALSILE